MASTREYFIFQIINFVLIQGNIIIQSQKSCGSNMEPRVERIKDLSEFMVFSHIGRDYYAPNADCVVTLIGEKYHQWNIELQHLDMSDDYCVVKEPCCSDYLKLFNAYTVDNARLFPSIPWRGLCGMKLPRRTTFTSTQNYVTIQFNSDLRAESKRGFSLRLRQYPRRSAGNDFFESGFVGGWNDGSLNELQIDWTDQASIPGDFTAGNNKEFEFDPNGIDCYNCQGCKKDYFRTSVVGVSVSKGCYVCTKEWLQGNAKAIRQCLSRDMLQEKLNTLQDESGQTLRVNDFRSCKTFARGYVGVTYIKLCVCDTDKCNSGRVLTPSFFGIAIATIVIVLINFIRILE